MNAERTCRSEPEFKNLVTGRGFNAVSRSGSSRVRCNRKWLVPPLRTSISARLAARSGAPRAWILGLAAGAGIVTFVGLSLMRPLYTSESRILIENDASPFTRAATDLGRDQLPGLGRAGGAKPGAGAYLARSRARGRQDARPCQQSAIRQGRWRQSGRAAARPARPRAGLGEVGGGEGCRRLRGASHASIRSTNRA